MEPTFATGWPSGSRAYWTTPLLILVQAVMVVVSLIIVMAYYTLAERKIIGWMQARKGPNRVNLLWIPGLRSRSRTCSSSCSRKS